EPEGRYLSAGDFARDATAALRGMRYTGPATVVATGEARPAESSQEPAEHPDPASEATTPQLPATALSATPEPPPAADAATRAHATTEHARSADRAAPTVSATSGHPLPPEPPASPAPDRV